MSTHLIIGLLNGEITDVIENIYLTAQQIEDHFPIGEAFMLAKEPHGPQWRVLQRSKDLETPKMRYFTQLLPIKVEQLPEIIRMAALMRE